MKRYASVMPDNLRSNLDKFHEEAANWLVFYFLMNDQTSKKIAQVISQNKQPEPDPIWDEMFAWEPGPVQSILAFFYPLLGSSSAIVEVYNTFWLRTHVGYDKSHSREKLTLMPLYLGKDPARAIPTCCLIQKFVQPHNRFPRRTANRPSQQVSYLPIKYVVCR